MNARFLLRAAPIILMFAYTLALSGCALMPLPQKTIHVVFRFDDYSSVSDIALERKILDIFSRHQAPITFAVIPFACAGDIHDPAPQKKIPLSQQKIDLIKQAHNRGILQVGLHGYSHQTLDAGHYAEFEGMDYENQLNRIKRAKQYLEDVLDERVSTFMPPWNRYDLNTLKALEKNGFSIISADLKGIVIQESNLSFLPANCSLAGLRSAIAAARRDADASPVIVVLFHDYDFKEINSRRGRMTVAAFSTLIDWLTRQPDVQLMSVRQAVHERARL